MTARPYTAGDQPRNGGAAAFDETYTKPSRYKQWQEHSSRPIAARPMTADDIEMHRRNLICSYQCADTDISFEFRKILDENDEDRDDCLLLVYMMKCVIHGKPQIKDIYTLKVPIPDEIKRKARHMQRGTRPPLQRTVRALPAPPLPVPPLAEAGVAAVDGPTEPCPSLDGVTSVQPPRPKLRRPAQARGNAAVTNN